MKWKIKQEPKLGNIRCRRVFAWMPTVVGEYIVWLERYEVKEEYIMDEWVEVDRWDLCWYP